MEELISKKKLIQDLNAVREVLSAQGDPFLAAMMTRAIGVVENQPVILMGLDLAEHPEVPPWKYDCSCCHTVITPTIDPPDYCPVCGVRTLCKNFVLPVSGDGHG